MSSERNRRRILAVIAILVAAGVLAFAPSTGTLARLGFLGRDGDLQPFTLGPRRLGPARLSPDDSRVAVQINDIEGTHIWIVSFDREGDRLVAGLETMEDGGTRVTNLLWTRAQHRR